MSFDVKADALGKRQRHTVIDRYNLSAHIIFPGIRTAFPGPPPVSFSPVKAPPISAPEVPMLNRKIKGGDHGDDT